MTMFWRRLERAVLILVLMDNQNTSIHILLKRGRYIVLILVLMDNQNTLRHDQPLRLYGVLILVLMDNQNTSTVSPTTPSHGRS